MNSIQFDMHRSICAARFVYKQLEISQLIVLQNERVQRIGMSNSPND